MPHWNQHLEVRAQNMKVWRYVKHVVQFDKGRLCCLGRSKPAVPRPFTRPKDAITLEVSTPEPLKRRAEVLSKEESPNTKKRREAVRLEKQAQAQKRAQAVAKARQIDLQRRAAVMKAAARKEEPSLPTNVPPPSPTASSSSTCAAKDPKPPESESDNLDTTVAESDASVKEASGSVCKITRDGKLTIQVDVQSLINDRRGQTSRDQKSRRRGGTDEAAEDIVACRKLGVC